MPISTLKNIKTLCIRLLVHGVTDRFAYDLRKYGTTEKQKS